MIVTKLIDQSNEYFRDIFLLMLIIKMFYSRENYTPSYNYIIKTKRGNPFLSSTLDFLAHSKSVLALFLYYKL